MNNISLISVYNNKNKLQDMLDSANRQVDVNIDYVLIDNSNNRFSSAAAALNYGMTQALGEVVVFLHQDIVFLDENQLKNIYMFSKENKNVIFGSAGVYSRLETSNSTVLTSMLCGPQKQIINSIDKPTVCFTLDECLIACHKDCFEKVKFDENACDGWHLYGADLCLQANLIKGMSVMVIPMNVWHKSNGNADKSYYTTQNELAKKYFRKYKIITTTNGFTYTNPVKRGCLNLYRKIKYGI